MPPRSMKTRTERSSDRAGDLLADLPALDSSSRFSRRSSSRATFSERVRRFALRLTSRILRRSFGRRTASASRRSPRQRRAAGRSTGGAGSRGSGWSGQAAVPQSTMRPPCCRRYPRLDDDARLELLLHRAPLALETSTAPRQGDVAFGDSGWRTYAGRCPRSQLRLALAMTTEQLAVADDALALGADVDEDPVLVDRTAWPSTTSPSSKP